MTRFVFPENPASQEIDDRVNNFSCQANFTLFSRSLFRFTGSRSDGWRAEHVPGGYHPVARGESSYTFRYFPTGLPKQTQISSFFSTRLLDDVDLVTTKKFHVFNEFIRTITRIIFAQSSPTN